VSEIQQIVPVSFRKWVVISAIIGYVALAAYLLYFVGFFNIITTIQKVNLGIYLLAIGTVIISITLHALVWFKLLNYVGIKLGFRRTNTLYWLGVFVDNLIPGGWAGDLFKAYLLGRDTEIDGGKAVASVVAKNMYEAIFNLGNLVLGLILLLMNYTLEGTILIGLSGVLLLLSLPLIILMVISFKPKGAKRAVNLLLRGLSRLTLNRVKKSRFQGEIDKLLDQYHEGMKILIKNPKMLGSPMILSFFAYAFEIATLYLVFVSLGFFVQADKVIIVRSIAGNVEAQGYAFAGYAQILTTTLYNALGINLGLAASVGILGGVIVFWLKTAISYAAFHCVVFANCANYVCNVVRATSPKECKAKEKMKS
jgi:uncharacterized protein (TIRG00374 family)